VSSGVGEDAKGATPNGGGKVAKFAKERISILLTRIISGR
jgi:hypothetical protein